MPCLREAGHVFRNTVVKHLFHQKTLLVWPGLSCGWGWALVALERFFCIWQKDKYAYSWRPAVTLEAPNLFFEFVLGGF